MAETTPRRRVADFPRPPALERERRPIRIVFGGDTIATAADAWRILERTHPPSYYLPWDAFVLGCLRPTARRSVCEWKGVAHYLSLHGGGRKAEEAGWYYPDPAPAYAVLRNHVAVYAGRMDACFVGEERVEPQPGGFYGGWITGDLEGPFKGAPGTEFW